jgi:hypothetical protein
MIRPESAPSADSTTTSTLAAPIRRAVIQAGEAAYEDAGIQGLCAEGRWEAAVAAMRAVGLDAVAWRAALDDDAAEGGPHPSATG